MKWNKEKTSYLLSAILILFVLFMPSFIQSKVDSESYEDWLTPDQPAWQGQLSLWAVVGFPVSQNTLNGWVKSIVSSFERDNFGVYVDVEVLKYDDAKQRMSQGEMPDVVLFPSGFFESPVDKLEVLKDNDTIRDDVQESAIFEGAIYAYPVMMGGYGLVVNEDRGMQALIEPPTGINYSVDDIILMADGNQGGICFDNSEFCNPGFSLVRAISNSDNSDYRWWSNQSKEYSEFESNKLLLCLGTHKTSAQTQSNYENGNGFASSNWAVSDFTDMVQYVGTTAGKDENKFSVCSLLANSFVSPETQESLKDIGMFKVIESEPLYEDDNRFFAVEQVLSSSTYIPNCFGYEQVRERWSELMNRCNNGDVEAFNQLLNEMDRTCKP